MAKGTCVLRQGAWGQPWPPSSFMEQAQWPGHQLGAPWGPEVASCLLCSAGRALLSASPRLAWIPPCNREFLHPTCRVSSSSLANAGCKAVSSTFWSDWRCSHPRRYHPSRKPQVASVPVLPTAMSSGKSKSIMVAQKKKCPGKARLCLYLQSMMASLNTSSRCFSHNSHP